MKPLEGLRVLDFSTLLPGPLASLMLADAGAEVIKVERFPGGDEMRTYGPRLGEESLLFAQLNRGKRSIALNLKLPGQRERLMPLLRDSDILLEQFRPGVMERLGLGYETLKAVNSRLIYCSLTGFGATGPKSGKAGHDLNFLAESGLLSLALRDGTPMLPPVLIGDIGAGAFPTVINILLGLQTRALTGEGCHLDISMNDNVLSFLFYAVSEGLGLQRWHEPGREAATGGSPRYNVYRTSDGRYLAAAPLEQKFWDIFCERIDLPRMLRDDSIDSAATMAGVAARVRTCTADHWRGVFDDGAACVSVVMTLEEALRDAHYRERGVLAEALSLAGRMLPAAPVPIDASFHRRAGASVSPALGEANYLLDTPA